MYEVLKVKKVIHNNIFKHVTFCKDEGRKAVSNNSEQKNKKIIKLGKSREKADLSRSIGYQYNIMKFSGYDEENRALMDRALYDTQDTYVHMCRLVITSATIIK